MVRVTQGTDGLKVEGSSYRLFFPAERPFAMLDDMTGHRWAELFLGCSVHAAEGLDETARLEQPVVAENGDEVRITIHAVSSLWLEKALVFVCRADDFRAYVKVRGAGRVSDVNLFGGYYSGHIRWGSGFFQSGARFQSIFNPEPWGSERRALPAGQSTLIDVLGTSLPGKGHWFFTPPPFVFAVSQTPVVGERATNNASFGADQGGTPTGELGGAPTGDAVAAAAQKAGAGPIAAGGADDSGDEAFVARAMADFKARIPDGPWLTMGLCVKPGEHNFISYRYEAVESAFNFRLDYEGQTGFDGEWESPAVLFQLENDDPYAGIERYTRTLAELNLVKLPDTTNRPKWWSEPIQCGWGAQCHLSNLAKGRAPDFCTQENYDGFLAALHKEDLHPGIFVLDDKWSSAYGTCEADPKKWPDLKGWIARRHAEGAKVLLWWKAWDPEGLPADQCVTNAAGMPVGADPSNPAYEETLRKAVRLMLSAEGYNADGFKVDFSARVPSGPGLVRHGKEWGVELLHKLLWILHDEAKKVKPDALVMTHTPNPYFATVTDMIRLNDINGGVPVVPQMIHRARVAKAACPTLVIDTDNWPMPSRAQWREYLKVQLALGVPSLYFATDLDCMEPLEAVDYANLRKVFAEARRRAQ
ncbi:MAG: hypothetical protein ACM3XM_03875 [Mycobacterium leprae]